MQSRDKIYQRKIKQRLKIDENEILIVQNTAQVHIHGEKKSRFVMNSFDW